MRRRRGLLPTGRPRLQTTLRERAAPCLGVLGLHVVEMVQEDGQVLVLAAVARRLVAEAVTRAPSGTRGGAELQEGAAPHPDRASATCREDTELRRFLNVLNAALWGRSMSSPYSARRRWAC